MKIDVNKVLIGSDFEMFVVDNTGKFVSAIPYIEGTKNEPMAVSEKGHMIQHDGVLAECNVPPVGIYDRDEFWKNVQFVMQECSDRLPDKLKLECCANGDFAPDQLNDPEAREAGCTISYNAWTQLAEEPPNFSESTKRCAGFHIHISAPGFNVQEGMRLIRIMDINVALPMLFVDKDRERRLLYGKMGSFRYKDYNNTVSGVEFRVLSNVVIKNKEIFDHVWASIQKSISQFNKGMDYIEYKENAEKAINGYNLDIAETLCEALDVERIFDEELV